MSRQIFVGCFVLLSVAAFGQREYILDVTEPPVNAVAGGGGGCGTVTTDLPRRELPVELRLARIEKSEYALGDSVQYEITLRNLGSSPILFPWKHMSDPAVQVRRNEPASVRAAISLRTKAAPTGREYFFSGVSLLGNASVPDSVISLQRGEVARIKIRGPFLIADNEANSLLPQRRGQNMVQAVLSLSPHQCEWNPRIISVNAMPLDLSRLP